MTDPDGGALGDAAEADVVEQRRPIDEDGDEGWLDAQHVSEGRDWQASEADLIDQATAVPEDDPDVLR